MPQITLVPQQRLRIRDALLDVFLWERMKDLLAAIGKNGPNYEGQGSTPPTNMMAVVEAAEKENWLVELVDRAHQERPASADISKFRRELAAFIPFASEDPFEVCCLSGSHVMVNRTKLRSALRLLASPRGKRVLVVKDKVPAPPGQSSLTGKSHSIQLISYLKAMQDFRLVNVDLEATSRAVGAGNVILPSDLARRLCSLFGYDGIVPTDNEAIPAAKGGLGPNANNEQWARWNLEFWDKFEARASRDNARPCWVVIDQFNLVFLSQSPLDLVKELASRINVTLDHFRLILIGYASTLPSTVIGMVEEEMVEPIGEIELIDFFARAYEERRKAYTEDDVARAVLSVMNGTSGMPPSSAADLGIRISVELNKF
jgi:hypothetical protein